MKCNKLPPERRNRLYELRHEKISSFPYYVYVNGAGEIYGTGTGKPWHAKSIVATIESDGDSLVSFPVNSGYENAKELSTGLFDHIPDKLAYARVIQLLAVNGLSEIGILCSKCGCYESYDDLIFPSFEGLVDRVHTFENLVDKVHTEQLGALRILCTECLDRVTCRRCINPTLDCAETADELALEELGLCPDCWNTAKSYVKNAKTLCDNLAKAGREWTDFATNARKYVLWKREIEGWTWESAVTALLHQYTVNGGEALACLPKRLARAAFLLWLRDARHEHVCAETLLDFKDDELDKFVSEAAELVQIEMKRYYEGDMNDDEA